MRVCQIEILSLKAITSEVENEKNKLARFRLKKSLVTLLTSSQRHAIFIRKQGEVYEHIALYRACCHGPVQTVA